MKLDTKTIVIIAIVALILYKYWNDNKESFESANCGPNCETQINFCASIFDEGSIDYNNCLERRGVINPNRSSNTLYVQNKMQ